MSPGCHHLVVSHLFPSLVRLTQVGHTAYEIIVGQLRQVIASLTIEEINRDRIRFVSEIEDKVSRELHKVGMCLLNVNITNVSDDSGVLDAMGRKAEAEIREQARVDVAERERFGAVGVKEQERDQAIAVANADKEREISTRQAMQVQTMRTAELEATEIQGTNNSKAVVAESNMQLKLQEAEYFRQAETKQNEAAASVVQAKAEADARAAAATAIRVEAEQRAELEAPAKAMKAQVVVNAEAKAEENIIHARAEAEARFTQLEAEARGQYELLARKADGLGAIVAGVGGSEEAFRLLMLEHLDTIAETQVRGKEENGERGRGRGGVRGAGGGERSSTFY